MKSIFLFVLRVTFYGSIFWVLWNEYLLLALVATAALAIAYLTSDE